MKRLIVAIMAIGALLLCGCEKGAPVKRTRTFFMMDTVIMITAYTSDAHLLSDAEAECMRLEKLLGKNSAGGDVYRINRAGGAPAAVADETIAVLRTAIRAGEWSQGAFDITVAPIMELWGFSSASKKVPEPEDIQSALEYVDYRRIAISGNTVTLPEGFSLDLGGIAKGYIADQIAEYLKSRGVADALLDFGGNLILLGQNPETGREWTVGIQDPAGAAGAYAATVKANGRTVVTSGIYNRGFEEDGVWYHHVLDPKTGWPVQNELASVTILTDSSAVADAVSTSALCLGLEKGMALIQSLPDTEAVFITKDGDMIATNGARVQPAPQ